MSETPTSVQQALQQAEQQLAQNPDIDFRLEAALLLGHVLDKGRTWLIAWPDKTLTDDQIEIFQQLLQRRCHGEPISHITGTREFWGLSLEVTEQTLIPRPETELMVETVLQRFADHKEMHVLDLGTGSGAIAAALASERPDWCLLATDRSSAALEVASRNFSRLGLPVATQKSDWFKQIQPQQFDLIVSNPPYIESADPHLGRGDLRFEPLEALAAGPEGLDDLQQIIADARAYLRDNAALLVEHGYQQGNKVRRLFQEQAYYGIETLSDYASHERITLGFRPA
ncbi:MAG: peptide chain release factor N(5)-glutamine methyltransferase [Chromatiales bacterium]|jgi:release factor glutamine methyltransferase